MSHRNEIVELPRTVIVGVDTHKHIHVAVALDALGARLATCSASADRAGYMELVAWARALGIVEAFGIEGTGSYGVGLASFVRRHAIRVVEVSHCDRRKRRNNGKSDTIDAETAARSVLSGIATAIPKTADGAAEMVRQIKTARDTAVKARSAAIITLKSLIVNASDALRESLDPLTDKKLIDRCAALVPGDILDPTASAKHSLRALARRWLTLAAEIRTHDDVLDAITHTAAPTGVVARIVTGPHDAHRQDPHLPMRYDTGRPRAVIRLRISQPRTTSLPCPAGLRARRPSPMRDL